MKKLFILIAGLVFIASLPAPAQIITTFAGNGTTGYTGDNIAATTCEFAYPSGLFMSSAGNLYIGDDSNARIRMITPAGIVTTVAGNGTLGYSGDGGPATNAQFDQPWKVVLDRTGNMYIADVWNQVIRKVDASGMVSTYAGIHGVGSYYGDGGPATAAYLNHPVGLAVDKSGNLYIGDVVNNVIRKVSTAGIITTVAGNVSYGAGSSGDGGPATAAQLNLPYGIAVDTFGNMYIGDASNNKVRMVDTAGIISTIAGTGTLGYSGDGAAATMAELNHPIDLTTDNAGNIFVSDVNNNCIRKINKLGIITTVAGNDTLGYSGDGGPATNAKLYYPCGVALDAAGNVYIADEYNQRVRQVHPAPALTEGISALTQDGTLVLFPNPSKGTFTLKSAAALSNATIFIYNLLGEKVYTGFMTGQQSQIILNQPPGTYLLSLQTGNAIFRQRISIANE